MTQILTAPASTVHDAKTLAAEFAKAGTVDEVAAIARKVGAKLSYEQADRLFGRINQTKCDAAELSGDTIEHIAQEVLGV